MSLQNFDSLVRAYNGEPTDSAISFDPAIQRELLVLGVTFPREAGSLAVRESIVCDLVGVWEVTEPQGDRTYHVVRSDTRDKSGISIHRIAAGSALEEGVLLHGEFPGTDVLIPADETVTPTIGGRELHPIHAAVK